jgi:PAS domain S-box-containing protein
MSKYSILIVEDEALIAANLVHSLSSLGYTIFEPVASGDDAIRAVTTEKPDLILMDIELYGEMNGIEAAKKIREFADIPVVYLTAYTDDLLLKQAMPTEPYGYIVKPSHTRELHAVIEMALYKHALDLKLRESEEKYHNLSTMMHLMCDNMPDMIWAKDVEKRYIFANKAICRDLLNAADTDEPTGKHDMFFAERERLRHADDPEWHTFGEICRDTDQITMDAGTQQQFDEYGNVQGKYLFLDVHKAPFIDEHGKMIGTVGSARDVTLSKQLEAALRESEGRFHTLAENAPVGIYFTDANGDCSYVNHEWSRITGLDFDRAQKKGWSKTLHPDDLARVESGWYAMVESGGTWGMMYRFVPSPGKTTWVYGTAVKIVDSDGRLTGYLGCNMDITERKLAEEQIILKNIFLSTQQETSPDGILIVDENAKILNFNRRFTEIWGIPPDLIEPRIDEPVLQFVTGQLADPEVFLDRVRYLYDNKEEKSFEELSLKDGRLLERFSAPILGEQGKYYGRVWYFRDITGRRQAEEALQEANRKLKLLSGITRHDINNQLTVLIGNLRVLHKKQPEIAQNEYLLKVLSAANRISAMIKFTKEYEEIGVHAPAWQDCRGLVDVTEVALGQINLINDLPDGLEVFVDPLIVKVFYNLLDNAVRYGGKITTIRLSGEESGDDYLIVCEDDGAGVPAEEKEKIFERGYGKNTGLGLALSREILSITDITIAETGVPGKGARFEIMVPNGAWLIARKEV